MRISKVILCLLIFSMVPFVFGAECSQKYLFDNSKLYYKFEEAAKPFTDEVGTFDLQYGQNGVREAGKIAYGHNTTGTQNWAANSTFLQDASFTICGWYKKLDYNTNHEGIASYYKYVSSSNANGWNLYVARSGDTIPARRNKLRFELDFNSTNEYIYSTNTVTPGWHFICAGWNTSNSDAFVCLDKNCSKTDSSDTLSTLKYHSQLQFTMGDLFGTALYGYNARGTFDEFSYYTVALNKTCLDYLYASTTPGSPQQYPFGQAFKLTVYYPDSTKHYKYYNGSIVLNSTTFFSCTPNVTNWTLQNTQPNQTLHFINPTTLSEKFYSIKFNCTDNSTGFKKNQTVNITIDRTFPLISFVYPANNSAINKNFTLLINYFDLYLYRTNTTIVRLSDNLITWGRDYTVPSGTTQWDNVSKAIILSNGSYPDGNYMVKGVAADTHTEEIFSEEAIISKTITQNKEIATDIVSVFLDDQKGEIVEEKEEVVIDTFERDAVEKTTTMVLDDATFSLTYPAQLDVEPIKEKDRYVFDHNSDNLFGETYEIIEAEKIIYLSDSPWVGHMIINDKYWFDAENLPNARISKIAENKYVVQWDKWEESVVSQSLGGLNENNKTLYFTIHKARPVLLSNRTISYGTGAKIYLNVSESVTYNATILQGSCTGTKRKTYSNYTLTTTPFIRVIGLNVSTLYYAKVQLHDYVNNNMTYCLNFTTESRGFYISDYSLTRLGGVLRLNASVVNSFDRPFVFNYSVYQNGILAINGKTSYLNQTGLRYYYKDSLTTSFSNITAGFPSCIRNNRIVLRWHLTNTGNQSASLSCNDGGSWVEMYYSSSNYRLYDEYLKTYFDNETNIDYEALNYTEIGTWSNVSDIFDSNSATYGFCGAGFDNCYLSLSYEVKKNQLRKPDLYYNVVNITNVSSGKYFILINTWDGYNRTETLNLTFNISFIASIYNELTGKKINNLTTNLSFVSTDPTFSQNLLFTTTSGTINIEGLAYVDYYITYFAPTFEKRHYYLAREDIDYNGTLRMYLLDATVGEFAIIKVLDQNLNPVEGAIVRILKNVPTFDEKQVISILQTNFEGEATLDFVYYTDDYQFIVLYKGEIVKISEITQVSKQVLNIQLTLTSEELNSLKAYTSAANSEVRIFDGTTSDKTCQFVFGGNNILYGCMRVFRQNLLNNSQSICEDCHTGTSGIATCNFNVSDNYLYHCVGVVDSNTTYSEYTVDDVYYTPNDARNILGLLGLFGGLILIITLVFAFRDHPSGMAFAAGIGVLLTSMLTWISWPWGGAVGILLVIGFFIWRYEQ